MVFRTFFSFNYPRDIKSLPGFVKGGRDKVPKEANDYFAGLISGWSEKEIQEHIESVATKSKVNLEISARNFQTPSYHSGTGGFGCRFFNYDFSVSQSEDDFSQCVFTGVLEITNLENISEIQDVIDSCFQFTFEEVVCNLPKGDRDLKELIFSLDDNKKLLEPIFDFSYENDFSSFHLIHKEHGQVITINNNEIKITFKASETIPEMIQALKEVNEKIFVATLKEHHLLTENTN